MRVSVITSLTSGVMKTEEWLYKVRKSCQIRWRPDLCSLINSLESRNRTGLNLRRFITLTRTAHASTNRGIDAHTLDWRYRCFYTSWKHRCATLKLYMQFMWCIRQNWHRKNTYIDLKCHTERSAFASIAVHLYRLRAASLGYAASVPNTEAAHWSLLPWRHTQLSRLRGVD